MEALWPISPDSPGIFLNKPNNQCDDDIPLRSEPLYLQSQWVLNACGWIQITQIVVTGNQSLEAKWAPVPRKQKKAGGRPNPTLSTDATNGSELAIKRGWPLLLAARNTRNFPDV